MTAARARVLAPLLTILAMVLAPAAAHAASTCAAQNVTVTPLQSGVFYVDTTSSYLGSYVGYKVTNTSGSARSNLWLRLQGFTGGVIAPADGAAATTPVPVGSLAGGAAAPAYAFLKAATSTTTAQGHDVVVFSGRPGSGGTELCRETQTISSVQQVIKASANKVTSASLSTSTASLGGSFQLTVNGTSGTIGAGIATDPGIVRFSPAVAASWPSAAFRLVGVSHQLPLGGASVADLLSRSNMAGASQDYSVTYTFRVVGATTAATPVVPVSNIASGTQVKHTDPGTFSSLAPIPQVTSNTTMSVAAGGTSPYTSGAAVPLTASIVNAGSGSITVDEVVLQLPTGWSPVAGSFQRDGATIADGYDAGAGRLRLVGPFTVAGGATSTFALSATAGAPGTSGSYTALATLDGGQIDGTTDPADDRPAAATLTVLGPPVARADAVSAAVGAPRDIDVLANDDTTGTPSLSIVSGPAHGTASVSGGHVTYQSAGGFSGTDTFTYRVTTDGGTATATVTVDVQPLPAPPTAPDVTSTGVGTAVQHQDVAVPSGGTVALRDGNGDPAATVTVAGQGDYALDAATGRITFTPVLGFASTATAVVYAATDAFGQTSTGHYTPTVTAPAAPAPPTLTSTGVGTATQTRTLTAPAGGSVRLLDADGHPATSVTVAGQGTYALDTSDGSVVFTPQFGFAGTGSVAYRATDAYHQHGDAAYQPTVTAPAPATPAPLTSSGTGTAAQQPSSIAIPSGGSVALVDAGGNPATSVTIAGQGTYVLDPATGAVTFTPVLGFAGTATPVRFRVMDAYGQAREATYTPQVVAPAPPAAPAQASTGGVAQTQSETVPVPAGGVAMLVGPDGQPTTKVDVEGVGTYEIEPQTGVVRFTPRAGFAGTPPVIGYRVIDAYGQATDGTYAPAVTGTAASVAAPRVDAPAAVPAAPVLPVATPCVSRRTTLIHWKVDRGAGVRRIAITLNGKAYKSLTGEARQALIDLHGRPAEVVTVRVTASGGARVLATTRTYRTCTTRTPGAPLPTLHLRPAPRG